MKFRDEDVQKALAALSRPLKAHELADAVDPEGAERPLAARSRSGHARGRYLIEQGWAVKNADGTYLAAALADPMQQPAETAETELEYEDGYAVRVRKEYLGPIAMPRPPAAPQRQAPPQQVSPAPQVIQPTVEQFKAWCTREWEAMSAVQHDPDEYDRRFRAFQLGAYQWNRAFGWIPPNPDIDRELAYAAQPPPRPHPHAPDRAPMHRHAPSNGAPSYGW